MTGIVVRQDGSAVAHAVVTLIAAKDSTATGSDGRFSLRTVAPGAYMLSVRRLGFRLERLPVTLRPEEPRDVKITMQVSIPMLPTVTTNAEERSAYRSVGLDQRMRASQGQFLLYDQIVHRQATSFTQLLQTMRGIKLGENPHQFGTTVEGTRGPGSCVAYMIDGVPQNQLMDRDARSLQSIGPESPDHKFDPSDIGALEVYSGPERPLGLGAHLERPAPSPGDPIPKVDVSGQQCMLVVIWTRTRLGLSSTPPSRATRTHASDVTQGQPPVALGEACMLPAAADTVDLLVYGMVEGSPPHRMPDAMWASYKGRVLGALDQSAALPSAVALPAFGAATGGAAKLESAKKDSRADLEVVPAWSNVIEFTLDDTGGLANARVAASALSPEADTSVLAIVERAAAAHAFPSLPLSGGQHDSATLTVVVTSSTPKPDTRAAVFGQLEVPVWNHSRPAQLAATAQPGAHDTVAADVIVDDAGHPVPATMRISNGSKAVASSRSQSDTLRALLPQLQFEPAVIGTCHVPELVTRSFAVPNGAGAAR